MIWTVATVLSDLKQDGSMAPPRWIWEHNVEIWRSGGQWLRSECNGGLFFNRLSLSYGCLANEVRRCRYVSATKKCLLWIKLLILVLINCNKILFNKQISDARFPKEIRTNTNLSLVGSLHERVWWIYHHSYIPYKYFKEWAFYICPYLS